MKRRFFVKRKERKANATNKRAKRANKARVTKHSANDKGFRQARVRCHRHKQLYRADKNHA